MNAIETISLLIAFRVVLPIVVLLLIGELARKSEPHRFAGM